MSVIFPPVITGSLPPVKAVSFDGTKDYLSRAALSGVSDGPSGTISMWIRIIGNDTASLQSIFDQGALFRILRYGSAVTPTNLRKKLLIIFQASGPTSRISYTSGFELNLNVWNHVLISWNTASGIEVYINDALDTPVSSSVRAGNINYDFAMVIGATTGLVGRLAADMAEIWMDLTTKIDFTVEANRRKFITGSGRPARLGANGELPTGSSPALYLKGPASNWGTNSGTGGNFTVTGSFTDATPP